MAANNGQILLILASADLQTAAQLTAASDLTRAETLLQLACLVEHGFIVASAPSGGLAVYRLNPKGMRTDEPAHARILLIEDDHAIQDLMTVILEDEGYALVVAQIPTDAEVLLRHVEFDLVITDAFSDVPLAVLPNTAPIIRAAGSVPVALFTAHRIELDDALAAGFSELITKPFDVTIVER